MEQSLHRVHERLDCGDFVMPAFFFILMRYPDNAVLPKEIMERLKAEVLGFKYWIDEPGVDIHLPCYFTENHQILFHTIEYLAGQLYPDEIFSSNGQTGSWHKEHASAYLRRWLTWRRRFGFSEWLSSTYYAVDLLALITLRELCDCADFCRQADRLLQLLLLDMAVHSFRGCFCATSGRMYNAPTMYPAFSDVSAAMAYLWGDESARRHMLDFGLHPDVVVMAVSDFQAPKVIEEIARDPASPVEAFQRMSINVEDSDRFGVDPSDFDNIMLYWSLHTFHHRRVIENSRRFCPSWYNMDAAIAANLEKFQLMERAGAITDQDPNGSALTEVNIYTYRTSNYMLSCAQDYRHGRTNFQQHIWQAILGGEAATHGTFAQFTEALSRSVTEGDTFRFRFESPSLGTIETGWNEPFTVNGKTIPVRGYRRCPFPCARCPTTSSGRRRTAPIGSIWPKSWEKAQTDMRSWPGSWKLPFPRKSILPSPVWAPAACG